VARPSRIQSVSASYVDLLIRKEIVKRPQATGSANIANCTSSSAAGADTIADRFGSNAKCKTYSADSPGTIANRESYAADRFSNSVRCKSTAADVLVNCSSLFGNDADPPATQIFEK
jgi:hypothetical protein